MSDALAAFGDDLRGDLLVAGVAASSAVTVSLVTRVLFDLPVGPLLRLSPLLVYPLYLLLGRGDTGSVVEQPGLWAALAALVGIAVVAIALV